MAKLSDLLICMKAVNEEGEGLTAVNILSAITPEYVPGLFTFSVIAIVLELDLNREHNFSAYFKNPNGDETVHIDSILPSSEVQSNLPPEQLGLNIAMEWNNVDFKCGGLYTLEIWIDGELLGKKQIFVKGQNE